MHIRPTLRLQSIGFCIGSTLFALGAVPGLASVMGANTTNIVFFVGSWFFTGAAFIQLLLAGPHMIPYKGGKALSAVWLTAAWQFIGTILFNISTGSAIEPHAVKSEQIDVWTPNAVGSAAFLISACFGMLGIIRSRDLMKLIYRDTFSGWANMVGCIAFGVSAVGAYIYANGATVDAHLANLGTLIGGICFFLASMFYVGRAGSKPSAPAARAAAGIVDGSADATATP